MIHFCIPTKDNEITLHVFVLHIIQFHLNNPASEEFTFVEMWHTFRQLIKILMRKDVFFFLKHEVIHLKMRIYI